MLATKINLVRVRNALQGLGAGMASPVAAATLIVANLTPSVEDAMDAYCFERTVSWINQLLSAERVETPELLLQRLIALSAVSAEIYAELAGIIERLSSALANEKQTAPLAA